MGVSLKLCAELQVLPKKNVASGHLGAFVASDVEIRKILVELRLVDDRPDFGALLQGMIHLQRTHPLAQGGNEPVVDALGDNQPARCRATLTG